MPERHLVGLLNVCCLFSPTVYLTDVHLGDNPLFLASYTSGVQDGLYARVRELAKLGCIRLLLRDESVRERGAESVIACESFSDVFRSWLVHDNDRAGVSRGIRGEREHYFLDLDRWAADAGVDRYSYRDVKQLFMTGCGLRITPVAWTLSSQGSGGLPRTVGKHSMSC